jgi:hypothetical protein
MAVTSAGITGYYRSPMYIWGHKSPAYKPPYPAGPTEVSPAEIISPFGFCYSPLKTSLLHLCSDHMHAENINASMNTSHLPNIDKFNCSKSFYFLLFVLLFFFLVRHVSIGCLFKFPFSAIEWSSNPTSY